MSWPQQKLCYSVWRPVIGCEVCLFVITQTYTKVSVNNEVHIVSNNRNTQLWTIIYIRCSLKLTIVHHLYPRLNFLQVAVLMQCIYHNPSIVSFHIFLLYLTIFCGIVRHCVLFDSTSLFWVVSFNILFTMYPESIHIVSLFPPFVMLQPHSK